MKKLAIILGGLIGIVGMFAGVFYFYSHPFIAGANPSQVSIEVCYTDGLTSSTSTVKYLSAGRATSTIGHTTLCDVTLANNTIPTALNLIIQQEASSTALSVIDFYVQTSPDGKQWSIEPVKTFDSVTATTTQAMFIPVFKRTFLQVSTTTEILSGISTATSTITVQIPNPNKARFVKVLFVAPVGAQPSNLWAEIIPNNEVR